MIDLFATSIKIVETPAEDLRKFLGGRGLGAKLLYERVGPEVEPLSPSSKLWDMPNVLVSSHSASTVAKENERIVDIFCHNLECYLDGRLDEMKNVLDKARMY